MSRIFLSSELEGVAVYWRIERKDGVTLGFTSHDRDLEFDGLRVRAAPGMVPSAIRRTATLELDNAEAHGALSHDSISSDDLDAGRFDYARIEIGLVDWETLERSSLYSGEIGATSSDGTSFEADLRSAKAGLDRDAVPRTSPTCRAKFCGPGCGLSAHRFTHEAKVAQVDWESGRIIFDSGLSAQQLIEGAVRWLEGPHAGIKMDILDAANDGFLLDNNLASTVTAGLRVLLFEGCDHTLTTCASRFANAVNFQGEPFLPGNDAVLRYPASSS